MTFMTRLPRRRAGLLALLGLSVAGAAVEAQQPPNILLVVSDDHSASFLGAYGNTTIRTPNLDRFADEGIRFDRAYVSSPQCVPSRAAIMTGRSPVATGMTRFSAPLPREVRTFPELLRSSAGYYTGILGRSFHLDGSGRKPPETEAVFERHRLETFAERVDHLPAGGTRERVPAQMKEFLDRVPAGTPFFLQVGFSDPHRPLDRGAVSQGHAADRLVLPPFFPDTRHLREDLAAYYDEVGRLDEDFGRVLGVLNERGLDRNTVVVFIGDNGGALLRGKGTLYELGIRVPLLLRWPGVVAPGRTSGDLISGEDLAPTFLQIAGVAPVAEMTGRSMLRLLRAESFDGREYAFSERGAHGSGLPVSSAAFDLGRAVVSSRYKLIYNALWQIPYTPVDFAGETFWKELQALHAGGRLDPSFSRLYFQPTRSMFELYDLTEDPHEMRNLAGRSDVADRERELKAALQEWMILNHDYLPLPVPPPPARSSQ